VIGDTRAVFNGDTLAVLDNNGDTVAVFDSNGVSSGLCVFPSFFLVFEVLCFYLDSTGLLIPDIQAIDNAVESDVEMAEMSIEKHVGISGVCVCIFSFFFVSADVFSLCRQLYGECTRKRRM